MLKLHRIYIFGYWIIMKLQYSDLYSIFMLMIIPIIINFVYYLINSVSANLEFPTIKISLLQISVTYNAITFRSSLNIVGKNTYISGFITFFSNTLMGNVTILLFDCIDNYNS